MSWAWNWRKILATEDEELYFNFLSLSININDISDINTQLINMPTKAPVPLDFNFSFFVKNASLVLKSNTGWLVLGWLVTHCTHFTDTIGSLNCSGLAVELHITKSEYLIPLNSFVH